MKQLLLSCILFSVTGVFANNSMNADYELSPIRDVQHEIMQAVSVFSTTNYVLKGESPIQSVNRIADDLMKLENCSSARLLLQVAIAYTNEEDSNGYSRTLINLRALLGYVLFKMKPSEIVADIAPYYDLNENIKLRNKLDYILNAAVLRESRITPDFALIIDYVDQHKSVPSKRLVGYMIKQNPDQALAELHKLYMPTNAMSAEYKAGNSIKGIKEIAAGGAWWEELYAAEKMYQNPKLRNPELIKQLKNSNHEIVRETIQSINNRKK